MLKEAWRLGLMSAEDYQRAADFANVKATREPAGEYLPEEVIGALLAVCDADLTLAGARDGAIIAVLDACGLCRAELVAAQYAHYQRATRMLRIIGKGNKQRTIPVNTFAARYLEAWLASRGNAPGPLFPRLERGGNKIRLYAGRPRQMTPAAVKDVLDKRAGQAGTGAVRPHDARRTFVSNMLRVTDAIQTARMAGHASVDTTMRYDLRPDEELRGSADRLRAPQVRPLRPAPTSPPQSPPA
ncbi:tyrosine-type recombinase/integrase [Nonomuraea sp. NPDC046570]|uniref:tyrosine-type recombinase/integrase n=1 Tax=Nonomuraea sp. NPDC046570 TaxID=3155255 RepID=UPI0033FA9DC2